jgi:hypothetical protein
MDVATAQAKLTSLLAAYDDAMGASSETVGDRSIVHQKLETLANQISWWQSVVDKLTAEAAGSSLSIATAKWES